MSESTAFELTERLKRKAPELLDLLTAQSDIEFEQAFDQVLSKAIDHLEHNSKNFLALDEEGLTAVIAGSLSAPGLSVTQETNSNGHVDLTIRAVHSNPARTKLGEAKIYDGPVYHFKGMAQLLGRYTTGREGRGLMLVYVRKQKIAELMEALRQKMDKEQPCKQNGTTAKHTSFKWSFLSKHGHSSGEEMELSHIGCNLFVPE